MAQRMVDLIFGSFSDQRSQECDGVGGASALVVWQELSNESSRRGGRRCGGGFVHGGFSESVQALVKQQRLRYGTKVARYVFKNQ